MEQRSEPQLNLDQALVVTCWEKEGGSYSGRLLHHSGDGIKIKLERSLDLGGILKLEAGDHLVLAEVRECEADDSGYAAGLEILACVEKSELDRLIREAIAGVGPEHMDAEPAFVPGA